MPLFNFKLSPIGSVPASGYSGLSASVPGQVTNLTVTIVSDVALDLSWSAPGSGGSPITGYKIERKIGAGSWGTLVADTGTTDITYSDTGLTESTLYTYRVSAINVVGTGTASAEASATTYDSDAYLGFAYFGDLPTHQKTVINEKIIELKNTTNTSGTVWDRAVQLQIAVATKDDSKTTYNWVTGTNDATLHGADEGANQSSMLTPTPWGYVAKNTDYMKSGITPSTSYDANSSCRIEGMLRNKTGSAGIGFGAFVSAAQVLQCSQRSVGNSVIIDKYNNTGGQGRATLGGGAVTDIKGVNVYNRNASNYTEVLTGGVLYTYTTSGGSLPNIAEFDFARNNAGTVGSHFNKELSFIYRGKGLTTTQRAEAVTIFTDLDVDLGDRMNPDYNINFDGNSLSKYLNHSLPRQALYYTTFDTPRIFQYNNIAVPGQNTAAMLTNYAANAAPLYSVSFSKNIYVIDEVRNHIWNGATVATAKQTLTDLVAAAKATGYIVIVNTVRYSTYVGNTGRTETEFNLAIDEMNTYILANSFGADFISHINDPKVWRPRSEFASDALYNTDVATKRADVLYFLDETHMTDEGYRIVSLPVSENIILAIAA